MDQKIAKICPNCGGRTANEAASFCPYCGGSLLGKTIESGNRSVVETVNEIEDENLKSWNGIERPEQPGDLWIVIGSVIGITAGIFGVIIGALLLALFIIAGDFSLILGSLSLFGVGPIVLIIICVFSFSSSLKSLLKERKFMNGKKDIFIGEIRSYGTGKAEKPFNYVSVRDERGNVFVVKTKSSKRKFYIGEKVRVTVSNGIYDLDKIERVE